MDEEVEEKNRNGQSCPAGKWGHSLKGMTVEVRRAGEIVRIGIVDDASKGGSVVWIAQDGVLGRFLIHEAEGYEIRVKPGQLQVVVD
jgi:hypothetical protein